jgi:autotransporter adhesin
VGLFGGERRIVNVANGNVASGSTDAVNGGQLFGLQSQINSGTIGLVQQSAAGAPITVGAGTNGAVVDFANNSSAARTLTGVAAGALTSASTDAVNGAQLLTANQRVADAFGTTLTNGQLNAPDYTIQTAHYNNVGSAFGAVDSAISNLKSQIGNGSIGLVQQNSGTRVLTVGASTDGTVVNMAGTAGNRQVTGVAAGALTATSTDAVNGSQLYATNQQVAANTSAIGTLTGQVAANTSDIATLNSTVAGISQSAQYVKVSSNGAPANASGANAIAIGGNAQATQSGSIAMGFNASSTGSNAIAIGTGATATGSVAVGAQASAANGGAAFGDGAVATGANSAALGANSSATAANSAAIGSGSTNTVANTVSFGSAGNERRLTNVAAGISTTDAVNVGQLNSVAAGIQSQIGSLASTIDHVDQRARRGIAAASAIGAPSVALSPGQTAMSLGTAYYRDAGAISLNLTHRLNTSLPLYVSGGYSNGGGSEHVGRAAMTVVW